MQPQEITMEIKKVSELFYIGGFHSDKIKDYNQTVIAFYEGNLLYKVTDRKNNLIWDANKGFI